MLVSNTRGGGNENGEHTLRSTVAVRSASSGLISEISVSLNSASSCSSRGLTGGALRQQENLKIRV